ncbi:hypothetical protein Nmel_000426 [Mimus melanotis]
MLPPQCCVLNNQCLYASPEAKRQGHVPDLDIKVVLGIAWFSPLLVLTTAASFVCQAGCLQQMKRWVRVSVFYQMKQNTMGLMRGPGVLGTLSGSEPWTNSFSDTICHPDFCVFISAKPAPTTEEHTIPQGILENSIKITGEPPTRMLANFHAALYGSDQIKVSYFFFFCML